MKRIIVVLALWAGGCKSLESVTLVGSAYVESDRPEGKAVAKIEVRYTPPGSAPKAAAASGAKKEASARPPVRTDTEAPSTAIGKGQGKGKAVVKPNAPSRKGLRDSLLKVAVARADAAVRQFSPSK